MDIYRALTSIVGLSLYPSMTGRWVRTRRSILRGYVMPLMIGVIHALGQYWCRFRWQLGEAAIAQALLHIMRIMALGADKPAFLAGAGPFTDALAMDALAPVPVDLAVTLTAQLLRLIEIEQLIVVANKLVAGLGAMTIETPDGAPTVLQIERIGDKVHMHGQLTRIFILWWWRKGAVMTGHPTDG